MKLPFISYKTASSPGNLSFCIFFGALSAAYFHYLFHNIENFPRSDDYRAVLDALILWVQNRTPLNFLSILFSQYNEHKILIVRLISILAYETEGVIDFKQLTLIGNLFFITIPLTFLVDRKLPLYFYIAIVPLFFAATNYGSSHWAMTSLSNLPVVWFACLAAHLALHPSRKMQWTALVPAFLATFSQGNGIAILLLLTVYALVKRDSAMKWAYLTVFVAATALFFCNWHRPPNPSLQVAIAIPLLALKYFFSLLGSAAFEPIPSLLLGIALVSTWAAYRIVHPGFGANDVIVLFILISAAMTTSNRLVFTDSATASKYSIYSLLFIAVVFCEAMVYDSARRQALDVGPDHPRHWLPLALLAGLSMSYCAYSWHYTNHDRDVFLKRMSHLRLRADGTFVHPYDMRWYLKGTMTTLQRSRELGIYTPPPAQPTH